MSLEAILAELVDAVPQAVGAILVDWEGEAVIERCHCDPYDLRFIAAHGGILLSQLKGLKCAAQLGDVEEVVFTSSGGQLVIGCIDREYALVMHISRDCPAAPALYHFRRAVDGLKREI